MNILDEIRRARAGVSFSGAGLSVASGLPAYRTSNGIWTGADPNQLSERALRQNPEDFWAFFRTHWLSFPGSLPNSAHQALVRLERQHTLVSHITQNVDGHITRAGSQSVLELHGTLGRLRCLVCDQRYPLERTNATIPICDCGALLRPDLIMYGDKLDHVLLKTARQRIEAADLVIVVGTTLDVEPAAALLKKRRWEVPTIIIDPSYVELRGPNVYRIKDVAETVLPWLADLIS